MLQDKIFIQRKNDSKYPNQQKGRINEVNYNSLNTNSVRKMYASRWMQFRID